MTMEKAQSKMIYLVNFVVFLNLMLSFKTRLLPRAMYGKHHAVQGISIPFLEDGLEFLHDQFASGLSYSAINTARSALSIINLFPDAGSFGNRPLTI